MKAVTTTCTGSCTISYDGRTQEIRIWKFSVWIWMQHSWYERLVNRPDHVIDWVRWWWSNKSLCSWYERSADKSSVAMTMSGMATEFKCLKQALKIIVRGHLWMFPWTVEFDKGFPQKCLPPVVSSVIDEQRFMMQCCLRSRGHGCPDPRLSFIRWNSSIFI